MPPPPLPFLVTGSKKRPGLNKSDTALPRRLVLTKSSIKSIRVVCNHTVSQHFKLNITNM